MTPSPRRTLVLWTAAAACAAVLALPLEAQQTPAPQQPAEAPAQTEAAAAAPAPGPVGGVEEAPLSAPNLGRSFIVPRFSFSETYDSNVGYAPTTGAAQSDEISTLNGGFTLQVVGRNSSFSTDYIGSGLIYDSGRQSPSTIQTLGVSEKVSVRRWSLVFGESFSYLPGSALLLGGLGFAGGGATGFPGLGGATGFNPGTVPTQSIAAQTQSEVSSSSSFQAQYLINGTSSISTSVVFGFLQYLGTGTMLDSRQITPRMSYDHSFTRRDTLSLGYSAVLTDYSQKLPGFTSSYVQVGYRRLLTGKLNFSVLAGPVISQYSPQAGMTTVPGGSTSVGWSVNSSLGYLTRRGSLNFSYFHQISAGSGFFAGTDLDQATGSATYQLSRSWVAGLTANYARNQSIRQTDPTLPAGTTATFNFWTAGITLSRNLGRYSRLNFNYFASKQTGVTNICLNGIPCGPIALVQIAGVSFSWSSRPLKLE